jgi:BTB/POZ domain
MNNRIIFGGDEMIIDNCYSEADRQIQSLIDQTTLVRDLLRDRKRSNFQVRSKLASFAEVEADVLSKIGDNVEINLRGTRYTIEKKDILKFKTSLLYEIISCPIRSLMTDPDDGSYFFDQRSEAFDRIIDYLHTGFFSCKGLHGYDEECVHDNLEYFRITLIGAERDYYISLRAIDELDTAFMSCNNAPYPLRIVDDVYGCKGGALITFNKDSNVLRSLYSESSEIVLVLQVSNFDILSFTNNHQAKLWGLDSGETKLLKNLLKYGDQVVCGVEVKVRSEYSVDDMDTIKVFCFGTVTGGVEICGLKSHSTLIEMWWTLSEGSTSFPRDMCRTIVQGDNYICAGSIDGQIKLWTKPLLEGTAIINQFRSYRFVKHYHRKGSIIKIIPISNRVLASCCSGSSEIAFLERDTMNPEDFALKTKFETRFLKQVQDQLNYHIIDMVVLSSNRDICCLVGNDDELSLVNLHYSYVDESWRCHSSVSIDTGGIFFPFSRSSLFEVMNNNEYGRYSENYLLISYRRQFVYEFSPPGAVASTNLHIVQDDEEEARRLVEWSGRVFWVSFLNAGISLGKTLHLRVQDL